MKPISKMDWDIIDARVTKACDRHKFQRRTVGFLAIVIDQVFPGHEDQLQEVVWAWDQIKDSRNFKD